MELQYQYPSSAPAPSYTQPRQRFSSQHPFDQYSHGHDGRDGYTSTFLYNSEHNGHNITNVRSKQTNPISLVNNNNNNNNSSSSNSIRSSSHSDKGSNSNKHEQETANESQPVKTHKGKIFQCTGFGDCRMVFTRSEHLARHARKHTGEKPFQCVVDGCTRMFSRFDNMVQHTQTHTKGAHPEVAEEIANRIAMESRRKSEAGLLGSSGVRRASSIKSLRAKRGSISSASGSESPQKASHQERIQSLPMLNMTTATTVYNRSPTPVLPSPVTPSSALSLSPKKQTRQRSTTVGKEMTGKIRKRQGSISGRRGSLGSISHTPTESWYASKLHHRPSLDYGLDQHAFFANVESSHDVNPMDNIQLPPMKYYPANEETSFGYHHKSSSSSFSRLRHPLSPPSDDMDSDDGSVHGHHSSYPSVDDLVTGPMDFHHHHPDPVLDDCTLPPLRHSVFHTETKPRLPSFKRLRSQSITTGATASYCEAEPSYFTSTNTKTRRLSLVDLNVPIQEANVAVNHSMLPHTGHTPGGVDVSEDEIKALEAFGQLWSQGRDIEMNDRRSMTPRIKNEFTPYEAPVPGPDVGRRPVPPSFNDNVGPYQRFCQSPVAMHLD